jgi:hypothetical protein
MRLDCTGSYGPNTISKGSLTQFINDDKRIANNKSDRLSLILRRETQHNFETSCPPCPPRVTDCVTTAIDAAPKHFFWDIWGPNLQSVIATTPGTWAQQILANFDVIRYIYHAISYETIT